MELSPAHYPLEAALDLQGLLQRCRLMAGDHEDIISLEVPYGGDPQDESGRAGLIRLASRKHGFEFCIGKMSMERIDENGKRPPKSFFTVLTDDRRYGKYVVLYDLSYTPEGRFSTARQTINGIEGGVILTHLQDWIGIVRGYAAIDYAPDHDFTGRYRQEFEEELIGHLVDGDADTAPFGHEQQLFLFDYLERLQRHLRQIGPEHPLLTEAAADVQDLQNRVQDVTKSEFVRRLSRIMAKIKKAGIAFIRDVYSEVKKEAIKQIVKGGMDKIPGLLDGVM